MFKIESYKCNYCGKLYANQGPCRNHENKCFKNPETRSCASCAFLLKGHYRNLTGRKPEIYSTCVKEVGIAARLKTKCDSYRWRELSDNREVVTEAIKSFDITPKVRYYGKNYSWWKMALQYVFAYYSYSFKQ